MPRVILALALLAAAGATYRVVSGSPMPKRPAVLETYGVIPDFQFTRQDGARCPNKEMLGKVSIANFIFTRCPTVCPVFTMKMQRVAEKVSDRIQLISFSVDPEYDTPERLAEYARDHGIDTRRWHFLTGEHKAVKDTVEGALKISMERQGEDENGVPDIVHGSHFVLFDGQGQIRGYYNSDDADRIATMIRDAESLAK
jgi:protein SCO1/2